MKLITTLCALLICANVFASDRAFSCNGLTPDGDALVYYVNDTQMFRVLNGEIGLTGLTPDMDSTTIALSEIDEDDLIVVGPGNAFISADIKAGRFGVLPFKCYRIKL